jgi:hypothetical protein
MRSILRRRRPKPRIDRAFTEEVVPSIWGIDPSTCTNSQLRAYLDHYEAASGFMLDNFVILNHAAVIRLVQTVQTSARSNVQDLLGAIENTQPTCLRQDYQPQSVLAALGFACKLWLFLELDFQDEQKFLTDLISEKLSVVKTGRKPYGEHLSKDFSQKTLVRRAGMSIVWTSDLSQHLELVGTSTIRVFMHAGALSAYSREAMR